MSKLFTNLKPETIDEQIEQSLSGDLAQQGDEDTRTLQDLQYLYRKDQILAHAQKRLMLASQSELASGELSSVKEYNYNTLISQPARPVHRQRFSWGKIATALIAAVVLIGALVGVTQLIRIQSPNQGHNGGTATATAPKSIATASPTADGHILLSDPLSQNIHNFQIDNQHFFKDGAYHILNSGESSVAEVLQDVNTAAPWSYSLTMTEIQGNTISIANSFGLIFAYQQKGSIYHFYSFEITNTEGGSSYTLSKYDSSQPDEPWQTIWQGKASTDFHPGLNVPNTVKVTAQANSLTITVNRQSIGTIPNITLASGQFGMIVNLQGSEVAFQNMLITRP